MPINIAFKNDLQSLKYKNETFFIGAESQCECWGGKMGKSVLALKPFGIENLL